ITATTIITLCQSSNLTVIVPAAYDGLEFTAFTNTITFDDYQMSQDVYLNIYPVLNNSQLGAALIDFPLEFPDIIPPGNTFVIGNTFGPEDDLIAPDENYVYEGLNSLVQLTLSDITLDPQENPDIVPPVITQPTALVNILNFWGIAWETYSNNTPFNVINMS